MDFYIIYSDASNNGSTVINYEYYNDYGNQMNPCDSCLNSLENGGSGICHCTLGQTVIY